MPSYVLIPMPKKQYLKEKVLKRIDELPAKNSKEEFKQGTLPETIVTSEVAAAFKFAFEYELEYTTLDGPKKTKASREIPIVFLDKGFLLIGYCTNDIQQKVLEFIEKNFVHGVVLNPIKFQERTLREAIENCPDVSQADIEPSAMKRVDRISCIGRGITDSEFWEDYGSEPLRMVKVNVSQLPEEPNVSFRKNGVIAIHNTSFTLDQQVMVLNYVVEKIIGPYLQEIRLQTKLV